MKETAEILKAYEQAAAEGRRCAIATVVEVIGSSYRRPGARMLVTDQGRITGAISGGCLEGDAMRRALYAIEQQQNSLVTYDTTDEDDLKFGVQLGCNGIVHILFEPVHPENKYGALQLMRLMAAERKPVVLVTLFSLTSAVQPGTALLYDEKAMFTGLPDERVMLPAADARVAFARKKSMTSEYLLDGEVFRAFVEFVPPPIALVIAGAGNDVQPLTVIASLLGWHTTVVDGRSTHATPNRFPAADEVKVSGAAGVPGQVTTDDRTAFLLMTHNYNYDLSLLKELLKVPAVYIGLLGPASKRNRLLADLETQGIHLSPGQEMALHGPVGLDIGAETAEEIAVSITGEINAFFNKRSGGQLVLRNGPIHSDTQKEQA